jgi:hypothetical protein
MVKRGYSLRARAALSTALVACLTLAGVAVAQVKDLSAAERRAVAAGGLNRASVVFAGGGLVVAIGDKGKAGADGGITDGVVLQGEVVSEEAAQSFGYRSMRSTLKIDCGQRRDLVTRMTVYSQPGGKGLAIVRQVPGEWGQPSAGAYLASVNRAICGPVTQVAAAKPKPAPRPVVERDAEPRRQADPPPPPRLARAVPVSDDPDMPMVTAIEAGYRPLQPTPAPAEPEAAPVLRTQAKEPESPARAPSASPRPAAKPASSARPSAPGKVSVQIAASPTDRQAQEALKKVRARLSPPLSTEVQKVVVDGKTYHRAIVKGFQTRADAQAFCAAPGVECFIR